MSDERPNRRGSTPAERAPGYRGALPPRGDALARPWIAVVVAAFVLMFVLAFAGVPSRFFPAPTVQPIPSLGPSSSFSLLPTVSSSAIPSP